LKLSSQKVDVLVSRLERSEERLAALREVVRDLVTHVQKSSFSNVGSSSSKSTNVGLFETDEEAEGKRTKAKELGQLICRTANDLCVRGAAVQLLSPDEKLREILGKELAANFFTLTVIPPDFVGAPQPPDELALEDMETNFIAQIQLWLGEVKTVR
jgi:hypothetical protein